MKQKKCSIFMSFFILFIVANKCFSQIGAEAQGGKLTTWTAIGLDKEISEHWLSITDFGYGRHSDPNNYSLIKRQGLFVLTQDFEYKMNSHWNFSFSVGYWRRNFYTDDEPFDERQSPYQFRNELRPFQRIYYNHNINNIKISHSFRTDYRFYYNQDFSSNWTTPFEFRARYLEKWKFPLTKNQNDWLIVIDEVLTAVDQFSKITQDATGKRWSPYQITENRLSCYYRRSINNKKIDLDFGIMHQYWTEKPGTSTFNVSYNLMFDIIFKDPFGNK